MAINILSTFILILLIENAAAEAFSLFLPFLHLLLFLFYFFFGGSPQTPLTLNSLIIDEKKKKNFLKI